MVGGTSPTLLFQADKVSPSQTIAGTLTGGLLNIDFQTGASSLSISGNLTAPVAGSLNFYLAGSATQTATDLSNARLSFANLQVSINDISCSTCTGSANGLIAGPAAEVAGVSYRFDTGAGTPPVSGVVGFDRTVRPACSSDRAITRTVPKSIPPGLSRLKAPGWNLRRTSTWSCMPILTGKRSFP